MPLTLNEPIVAQLKLRLNSDATLAAGLKLSTHITAINAAVTDGYTIDSPQQVLDYVPTVALLTSFPTIGIGDGPSRFEDDTGFSATGVHQLMVMVFLQDADQPALAWKLRRYEQAIARTILADRNLGTAAWGIRLVRIDPGPTLADNPENPKDFFSWTAVTIEAKKDEE